MLILTRKKGESIKIGDTVTVTVLSMHEDHVRIGVQAPRQVPVHRQEIYNRIQAENDVSGLPDLSGENGC